MPATQHFEAKRKKVAIVPTVAYVNGQQKTATQLNVISVADNLFDVVTFLYTLYDEHGQWAGEASFTLSGCECYDQWDASAEGAYNIVAKGVGLEILPLSAKSIFEV